MILLHRDKRLGKFFDNASVIFLFISFYFYLILETITETSGIRIIFISLSYFSFFVARFFNEKIKIQFPFFLYSLLSLIIYLISSFFWLVKLDINIYLSSITAILVINNYSFFLKALKFLIFVALLLSAYEFFNREYLFVVSRETVWGLRSLDERMFGGHLGIFRAKVFFEGPLALSQFAIGLSFLFRNNIKYLLLIFLIAVFANGRLGMIVTFLVIIFYFLKRYNVLKLLFSTKGILITIGVIGLSVFSVLIFMDESSFNRLLEAFNTSNDGNSARMDYWYNGIITWLNYDIGHMIFGNNGYFASIYNNNTENGWITLLVNNGIIGFLYYFIPILCLMLIKRGVEFLYLLLLFFCMFVQTFHLGASANLFYWLIMYTFIHYEFVEN